MIKESIYEQLLDRVEKSFSDQVSFLQRIVRIKSANYAIRGQSSPKEPIEKEVSDFCFRFLEGKGFRVERVGISEERPNLVVRLGDRQGKSLILNTHMDTVVPSDNYTRDPYSGEIEGDKLYGVGAADAKACIAAFIFALIALKEARLNLPGEVILTLVVDEELGACYCSRFGTKFVLEQGIVADAAIVGEPGMHKIPIGHRGGYAFEITTFGEVAHAGMRPWEEGRAGHNAIADMGKLIVALEDLEIPYSPTQAFPRRRPVFTFPTQIKGGIGLNIVPDKCVARGEARLLPGNTAEQIDQLMTERLKKLGGVDYSIKDLGAVPAVEISPKEEIVRVFYRNVRRVINKNLEKRGVGPGCDAWILIERGIPTICGFGPEGEGVHSKDEFVYLPSMKQVTKIIAAMVVDFLSESSKFSARGQ